MDFLEPTRTDNPFLLELESVVEEPIISRARENARHYNDILCGVLPTSEEVQEIVQELDSEVGAFVGCTASLTGRVLYRDINSGEFEKHFVEDVEVVFNGFALIPKRQEDIGDEDEGVEMMVQYHVVISGQNLYPHDPTVTDQIYISATAELDSVIELDGVSIERAQAWLTHLYPEIIDDIDARILGEGGGDVSERILKLRGFKIDNIDDEDKMMLCRYLQVYVNSIFPLDSEVPYMCQANGDAFTANDDETIDRYDVRSQSATLMQLKHFLLPRIEDDNGESSASFYVAVRTIQPEYNAPGVELNLSVDAIESVASLRYNYYS